VDVAVTGSSGLIGTALVRELQGAGHRVRRLVRRPPAAADEVRWDPAAGEIDAAGLAGIDAAINLAGEGIAEHRWTPEQKARIRDSRVNGTTLLATTMAALEPQPSVLLSGSAVGYYGDGGDTVLTESSPRGDGFLADVVAAWESATISAATIGIRTVLMRTGIVLSPDGGAMKRTLPLFKLGLGGRIGTGRQWWPWISIDDEVGAMLHLLTADSAGAVNLSAPNPVTNRDYTQALGRALHRPAVVPVPLLGPKLLLGSELAESLLGNSQRMVPERLVASGYQFRHPTIDTALASMFPSGS
jgi:uncharacterized protein (TIGR01777 family)